MSKEIPPDTKVFATFRSVLIVALKNLYPELKLLKEKFIDNIIFIDLVGIRLDMQFNLQALEEEVERIINEEIDIVINKVSKNRLIRFFKETKEEFRAQFVEQKNMNHYVSTSILGFKDYSFYKPFTNTGALKGYSVWLEKFYTINYSNVPVYRFKFWIFRNKEEKYKYLEKTTYEKKYNIGELNKKYYLFQTIDFLGKDNPILLPEFNFFKRKLQDIVRQGYEDNAFMEVYFNGTFNKQIAEDLYKDKKYSYKVLPQRYFYINTKTRTQTQLENRNEDDENSRNNNLVIGNNVSQHISNPQLKGLSYRSFDKGFIICQDEFFQQEVVNSIHRIISLISKFGFDWNIVLKYPKNHSKLAGEQMFTSVIKDFAKNSGKELKLVKDSEEKQIKNERIQCIISATNEFFKTIHISSVNFYGNAKEARFIDNRNKSLNTYIFDCTTIKNYEKFVTFFLETRKGVFPSYFSLHQVIILPLHEESVLNYCQEVKLELEKSLIRSKIDKNFSDSLRKRIVRLNNPPYILIVGDKEAEAEVVNVRMRNGINLGIMSIEELKERIGNELTKY